MARHVNHYDAQDNLISKNNRITRQSKQYGSGSLADRDPATLSIVEQEALLKERATAKAKAKAKILPKAPEIRITGKR